MNYHDFSAASVETILRQFKTSLDQGLSYQEVVKRQNALGLNELKSSFISWFSLLGGQLQSPFLYLLAGCALLSLLLGDIANTTIITVIIVVNVFLSFVQEFRANNAVKLLASYITSNARVLRIGKQEIIPSRELVPGDIVFLSSGDMVPADIRLIRTDHTLVDESVLTGESLPVPKDYNDSKKNIVYHGTIIAGGSAVGVVIATGTHTAFGRITMLTLTTPHQGSFQLNLLKLSRFLVKLGIAMFSITLILHFILQQGAFNITQSISFSVALAISITPQMLPLITLVALTQGALKLAAQRVIVKRLSAIEDLGSINVLCSDKTGTLTENKLTVADFFTLNNKDGTQRDPISYVALANPLTATSFEIAAFQALSEEKKQSIKQTTVHLEIPFDPAIRQSGIIIQENEELIVILKGAPEEIIKICTDLSPSEKELISTWEHERSTKGQRVLALAQKKVSHVKDSQNIPKSGFSLLGLVAFANPIKPTVYGAIQNAQRLGVIIKILTGDSPEVATAVASAIGLISSKDQVITGDQLEKMPPDKVKEIIAKVIVFARVTPEQKCFIIEHLKQNNTVGFLGDGINDAPALKLAHIGIAVCKASEIAQSTADIVMLKKSLSTIISAITLGRTTFINTMKYLRISLSSNMGNFCSIAIASLFLPYLPMLPLQIMIGDLLSDIPFTAVSTDNVNHQELKKPTTYDLRDLFLSIITFGGISSIIDCIFFFTLYSSRAALMQTAWFILSFLTELVALFLLRTKKSLLYGSRPSWLLIYLSSLVAIIGLALTYLPFGRKMFHFALLNRYLYSVIGILLASYVILVELAKRSYHMNAKRK